MTSTIPRTQRIWILYYLIERDGNKCHLCKKKENKNKLEIDHIDGNPANNERKNLRLLCHSCNVKTAIYLNRTSKNKHHGIIVEREGENLDPTTKIKENVDYQNGSIEMQANDFFELAFRNWLSAYLLNNFEISKDEAIASGAEITGGSINAIRNYLLKFTSLVGPGYEVKLPSKTRVIRLKKKYCIAKKVESEGEK